MSEYWSVIITEITDRMENSYIVMSLWRHRYHTPNALSPLTHDSKVGRHGGRHSVAPTTFAAPQEYKLYGLLQPKFNYPCFDSQVSYQPDIILLSWIQTVIRMVFHPDIIFLQYINLLNMISWPSKHSHFNWH